MYNYDILPEHCRNGMRMYIEQGIIPGSFLKAVICNDFVKSFQYADDTNVKRLHDYAKFLYWEAPAGSWGSEKRMYNWAKNKGGNNV